MLKPWYKRRRYWTLALLAALIYFCFIPSPLRVSRETTGYTEPLLPNGDVDYFGAYEQMYIHKLSPPEDNGYRLLLAACGPRILEQAGMMDAVLWEQLPVHELSKQWFEEQWVPLCEHMYIDPYAKPNYLDSLEFYGFMQKDWQVKHREEGFIPSDLHNEHEKLYNKLACTPWTAGEQPIVARWLEERSPVLDLFGKAVRKANFACYRRHADTLVSILLPDVQANHAFARDLRIRVTERLGKKDVEGAWFDVMSMLTLSRKHYARDPFIVIKLTGLAIEHAGTESAKHVLQHGNLTPEQLERFAHDLDSLPRTTTMFSEREYMLVYSMLQAKTNTDIQTLFMDLRGGVTLPGMLTHIACALPFDRNIAGKRIADFYHQCRKTSHSVEHMHSITTSMTAKRFYESMLQQLEQLARQRESLWNVWRLPLIQTRSEWVADTMIDLFVPAAAAAENAMERANAQYDLLRLRIALERYQFAEGAYPQELERLVPAYLEEVPLDLPTGRKSWVYKSSPDEETAYLLHSAVWDSTGKDQYKKELFARKELYERKKK